MMNPLRVSEPTLIKLKRIYSIWLIVQVVVIVYHLYFIIHRLDELPEIKNGTGRWAEKHKHTLYLLAAVFIGIVFEIISMLTGFGAMLVFDRQSIKGHSVFAMCCLMVNFIPTFLCDMWYHRIDFLIPFNIIFVLYFSSVVIILYIKYSLYQPTHSRFYTSMIV